MRRPLPMSAPGPWTAADIRPGEPWEISNGHRIEAMGRRKRGGAAQAAGALVIVTDPGVEFAAVEVGFSPHPQMLRVLGVAVLAEPADSEWAAIAPPLAIEYADTGQDEPELRKKIDELLAAGARIDAQADAAVLDRWLRHALTGAAAVDILE